MTASGNITASILAAKPLTLVACAAAAILAAGCGNTKSSSVKNSSSGILLEQTSDFSSSLSLTGDDQILTLGRVAEGKIAASSKGGVAFNIDLDSGNVETVQRYFSFDDAKSTVFTVSANFVWVIDHSNTMVGRNPAPPDSGHKIQISKVDVGDLVKDTTQLQPIAATEYQLFLLDNDSVVAFTWTSSGVNRQKIPLPSGPLAKDEYAMGAGSIDEVSKQYGFWMATNKRLLFYNNGWTTQSFGVKSQDQAPSLVSMFFQNKQPTQSGQTIALFGANVLSTLAKPSTKQTPKSGGST